MSENGNEVAAAAADPRAPRHVSLPTRKIPLGEELPIFCERCGYSLHGLTQIRCSSCRVLHFSCPECDHHQAINTLRPTFLRIFGRLRAMGVALIVFLKLNFFFWVLFGWGATGTEIVYRYNYISNSNNTFGTYQMIRAPFIRELAMVMFMLCVAFGLIGRMLLLRWRRGVVIGLVLGTLVALALTFGAYLQYWNNSNALASPPSDAFFAYLLSGFSGALLGCTCAWGIWLSLVHMFLPKRTAAALIEWQRAMSAAPSTADRTDATTSITV